jgi:hypothetical protein
MFPLANVVSPAQLALLRAGEHKTKVWGSVLIPTQIWDAQINDPAATRSTTSIAFDNGSGAGGAFANVEAPQEIWVGTSVGAKDVGRLRIKSISSGDSGISGTVTVNYHPHILANNHYLTFILDYPIRQKFPFIEVDGTFKKDKDIAYTDENEEPEPVVVCGTDRAGWLDPISADIVFNVSAADSYAIAEGASISSYACSVLPPAGSSVVFNTSTGEGTVTFTTTGYRWVKFTATDSNGKSRVSRRIYWVHDPDPAGADYPMFEFTGLRLNGDWNRGGWNTFFQVHNDATLADIPDETSILIWSESTYGTTEESITLFPVSNVETILNGFIIRDTTQQDLKGGAGLVNFEVHTPHEMLRRFSFSVSLEVVQGTPDKWWKYEDWLTIGRAIHHLWNQHSTIFDRVDVLDLMRNTLRRAYTEFEEGDLYSMADGFALQRGTRQHLVSDMGGRIHLTHDMQLLTDAERRARPIVFDIAMDDLSGQFSLPREPLNRAAFVKVSGFAWDGTFKTDANNQVVPDVDPICASAPGLMPADEGESVAVLDRQTWINQAHADQIAGRLFAKENNEYGNIPMTFHGNYLGVFDMAYEQWYTMSLQSGDTERGVIWTAQKLMCRTVSVLLDTKTGATTVNATFEAEAAGLDGVPAYCLDDIPDYGGIIPPIVDDDAPDALITGGSGASVYFKSGLGLSWAQRSTTGINDLIQDPFWPSKTGTVASNDAILFSCGLGFVERSIDGGQTWLDVTPLTDPPGGPAVADVDFVQADGSWSYLDEFLVIARYYDGANWLGWFAYTDDNGASFTWADIGGTASTPTYTEPIGFYDTPPGPTINSGPLGYNSESHQIRGLVSLTDTKSVMLARRCPDQSPFEIDLVGFVMTTDDTGDVTSVGSAQVIVPDDNNNTPRRTNAIRISDTHFAVGYVDYRNTGTPDFISYFELTVVICSVSGTTITVGTPLVMTPDINVGAFDIVKLSNTELALPFVNGNALAGGDAPVSAVILYGISGLSGTIGSIQNLGDGNDYEFCKGTAMDSTRFAIHMGQQDGNAKHGRSVMCRHDGSGTCTFGSTAFYYELTGGELGTAAIEQPFGIPLTATKWLLNYRYNAASDVWYYQVGSFNPTTLAITYDTGERKTITEGGNYISIAPHSATSFVEVTADDAGAFSTPQMRLNTVSGDTVSLGTFTTFSFSGFTKRMEMFHAPFVDRQPGGAYVVGEIFLDWDTEYWGATTDCNNEPMCRAWGFSLPAVNAKPLGLSIGKGAGDRVYVTYWDETNLRLGDYDLPAVTEFASYDLGAVTESELNNGTYLANPFAGIGDDDWVVVYGRMNDPYSLGAPTYVLESDDGGATAAIVTTDATWTSGECSALWMEPDGIMYAIRDLGTQSKLYYGNAIVFLNLMSTLPFPAGVNPHAIKIDPYDLAVYCGADVAGSIMVVKSFPLYSSWINMTFDHGTSSDINSLELL